MTDIFKVLRADHKTQRTLLGLVSKTHGDSEGRQELFLRLNRELRAHADAEERSLYSPMLGLERTQPKAGHSIKEHKDIEDLLEALEEMDFSNPNWIRKFAELEHKVTHHLDEEEKDIFPLAEQVLSEEQKAALAERFHEQKEVEQDKYPASR